MSTAGHSGNSTLMLDTEEGFETLDREVITWETEFKEQSAECADVLQELDAILEDLGSESNVWAQVNEKS